MQLTQKKKKQRKGESVRSLLSAASASLLLAVPLAHAEDAHQHHADGAHQHHAEGAPEQPWRVDAGAMRYSEKDRISVSELNFRARRQLSEDNALLLRADYDSVSGASPTGSRATRRAACCSATRRWRRMSYCASAFSTESWRPMRCARRPRRSPSASPGWRRARSPS